MSTGQSKGFDSLPYDASQRRIVETLNNHNRGKFNATASITLTVSAATTTLTDPRIAPTSVILFMPTTANAAAALSGLFVTNPTKGAATLNHPNNAQADRSFVALIIG